ncbi:hypothetical protein ACTJN2_14480 [Citrobacter freundii]|uniref:hypothetical protein n=1 Tax=Citrobacter freundii TaxID=546 RepID=UPI001C3AE16C|nr:hypothetical protein [Citrobacter freundii]MDE9645333.1 hypothetical protein [Citrobacter freundii]MDE9695860.1 hypothetical protein [Citrobacter freundii]MDE9699636.1 hypothetical protein [Citrobacter freundii]MEB0809209.1 hypothetical protein [Citrobacter freundii]HBH6853135.1 hypothetical protein [Citrobacter freundii]
MKISKEIFSAGISLGIDTMRKNLPEPLKIIEQGVIIACNDIGLNPEHEINGVSFVGRVMLRVMEIQLNEKLMPENEEDCSHLIFCTKIAAYADKFGFDVAAKEYSLPLEQVTEICRVIHSLQDSVAGLSSVSLPKMH